MKVLLTEDEGELGLQFDENSSLDRGLMIALAKAMYLERWKLKTKISVGRRVFGLGMFKNIIVLTDGYPTKLAGHNIAKESQMGGTIDQLKDAVVEFGREVKSLPFVVVGNYKEKLIYTMLPLTELWRQYRYIDLKKIEIGFIFPPYSHTYSHNVASRSYRRIDLHLFDPARPQSVL
ncbi:hypothetical protein DPMN_157134 [Dreissena polymorpha]|uniref:Uncharacterized protein n=1 Tax=Dreissena polymorpha TaxID=45954 RepID=A0A9D4IKT3_DREPO|nr:hypothetical protein DPMN_157134 [Dreissena polymorpha]